MNITVNGKPYNTAEVLTIAELLKIKNLDKNNIVVEVNEVVVSREDYGSHRLAKDDIVEILRFVGGG